MDFELRGARYEIKMECEEIQYAQVRNWVQVNNAAFREAFPPRQVNSLYFDTAGLDSFNDHIESLPERRKFRFRWYGKALRSARGQLELKCKRERVGWKYVLPVDADLDLYSHDWYDIQQKIALGIERAPDKLFYELLRVSNPLVIIVYEREYFVSFDEAIRLTVDYNLRAYDQWLSPRPNLDFQLPLVRSMMIEFKCAVEHSKQLADIIAEFPLRANRYSKYVTALDSLLER